MHALPVALADAAEKAGVEFRYDARGRARSCSPRHSRRRARRPPRRRARVSRRDTVVCNADLPVAYRTLLPGIAGAAGRPPRAVLAVGASSGTPALPASCPPGAAHHNIHFGREWDASFRALIDDGTRMADPSMLVTVPTIDEPAMAPARPPRAVRARAGTEPRRPGRLDHRTSTAPGTTSSPPWPRPAIPSPSRSSSSSIRSTGRRRGWSGVRRSRSRTRSSRPVRSGPPNIERRAPGLVFTGSATVPGVGVPMVLVSGKLAAERVDAVNGHR